MHLEALPCMGTRPLLDHLALEELPCFFQCRTTPRIPVVILGQRIVIEMCFVNDTEVLAQLSGVLRAQKLAKTGLTVV